jgi:hypothetical protein
VDVGTAIASAWSAGISMYGVAALLGLGGRTGWVDSPEWLQHGWVIAIAAVLFAVEFVVDKVPVVDSVWDAVHTALRPLAGAVLAVGADASVGDAALALTGGALAFNAHAAKASVRALVNLSPEPVTNVVVSTAEDGLVAGVMALALAYPEAAFVVTTVLVLCGLVVTIVAVRVLRRIGRRLFTRRAAPRTSPP